MEVDVEGLIRGWRERPVLQIAIIDVVSQLGGCFVPAAEPVAALSDRERKVVTVTSRTAISIHPSRASTGILKVPCPVQRPICRRGRHTRWACHDGPSQDNEDVLHFTPRPHKRDPNFRPQRRRSNGFKVEAMHMRQTRTRTWT